MQHRFNIQDLVHHLEVAASTQRTFAAEVGNDRLASQFDEQADQARDMANAFVQIDNLEFHPKIYIDGDQLVVEVA